MIRIPSALLEAIHAHARAARPQEACGLLAGRDEHGVRDVSHSFPIRNASPRPTAEYLLDPAEQLRTILHVEDELGLAVVGFYHSHPAGPARLSATDAARATWPGASHLLVHLEPTEGHLSARWDGERQRFVDEDVVIL